MEVKPKDGIYTYVFTFEQSTEFTDVQFKELRALLQMRVPGLVYYQSPLEELLRITELPSNTAVATHFKQSCILKTREQPSLLEFITKRAGYIRSCGMYVLTELLDKIRLTDFGGGIEKYVKEHQIQLPEVSFYTARRFGKKEPYTPYRLDLMLIDDKRVSIGGLPFKVAEEEMLKQFPRSEKAQGRIWVYKDIITEVSREWTYPEKEDSIYMVVFQPLFRNKNALHFLDEGKPYWKGIDTTPQRLMAAMLNLAQVEDGQVILEPFAHMGTSAIEATKFNCKKIYYNDRFEPIGAKDNLVFLTADISIQSAIIEQMRKIQDDDRLFREIRDVAKSSLTWPPEKDMPEKMAVETLMERHPCLKERANRLFFYMVRRYFIEEAIIKQPEISVLPSLLENLDGRFNRLEEYAENMRIGEVQENRGLKDEGFFPKSQDKCEMLGADILEEGIPLGSDSVDVIITDPPYGFGSFEDPEKVVRVYIKFFDEAFRVLKPGGRIVMCVLDKIRTGKDIPEALKTEGVIRVINERATVSGISFIQGSFWPLGADPLAISYWKAKHKLNRGILSFKIHKTRGGK